MVFVMLLKNHVHILLLSGNKKNYIKSLKVITLDNA